MFTVGERVQAVDELGRWSKGLVAGLEREEEEDHTITKYHISFPGYPEDGISVNSEHVRRPVLPVEQQERGESSS